MAYGTPNQGINQKNLKFWADVAEKICLGCILVLGFNFMYNMKQMTQVETLYTNLEWNRISSCKDGLLMLRKRGLFYSRILHSSHP